VATGTHRDDIQGLRAVAVVLVVLCHAGVGLVQGGYVGVDVFFVLSGFLITGLLLSRATEKGYVSLSDFYARRARRILPAATLTLVATVLASYHLLNFVRARQVVVDSIWASLFGANIHFGRQGTDYFAQWQPPSPVQQYWTLAVEEQFYLVWPALVSLILFGSMLRGRFRRRQTDPRPLAPRAVVRLFIVLAVAGIASLVWSIHLTDVSPSAAYFSTLARAWELALGAALSIAMSSLAWSGSARLPRTRALVGWLGLIGICGAAAYFSASTRFPGYAALLPTLGAALVIAAGACDQQSRFSVGRLLSIRPLRYVGDRSYAFYLWHWPVFILAVQYVGHELSVGVMLLLALGAFLLSMISYSLFENPIRQMRWPTSAGVLMWPVSAAFVIVVAVFTLGLVNSEAARMEAAAAAVQPGPLRDPTAVSNTSKVNSAGPPLPAVVAAVKAARRGAPLPSSVTPPISKLLHDGYSFAPGCAPNSGETKSKICPLGDTANAKTLVLMGDSFAQQWMPTILSMAQQDGWIVIPIVNGSGCASGSWIHYPARPWCAKWFRWALGKAKALHPDVTVIAGEWASDAPPEAVGGAIAMIAAAKRFSKSVIVVGVTPLQSKQPVDCLLRPKATMRTCTTIATSEQLKNDLEVSGYAARNNVGFIDPKPWFCTRSSGSEVEYWCPLVINRIITRIDVAHITAEYAAALAGSFRSSFRRELFR
jgi:peptidoglycan/LPS O-acetylase OafA/YrhL